MKQLRIMHTESSCGWGGQELRVLNECAGMAVRGHEIMIAAPEEAPICSESLSKNLQTAGIPINRKNYRGYRALRKAIAGFRPDLLVTHSSTDSWLTALASIGKKIPIVRTRHVSAPIPANLATRWLYTRACSHVVTTGEALRRQVIQQTGLAADRVTSVPTGIDLQVFSPGDRQASRALVGLPESVFIVGIVATLRSWKGHRFLVDAFASIRDQGMLLVIVGDGPGRDNLLAQCRALGIEDRVVMPGNQKHVANWLRSFDLFVLPSYANEGVPQALMQAMACGLPVITTPVGAIGEIVETDTTGLMVQPQSSDEIAQAVCRLRDDPILRERLGKAALAVAKARFSSDRMLDAMEAVFAKVIAE
jgi:glycosyltransferase involved in cell wall biosynthesis